MIAENRFRRKMAGAARRLGPFAIFPLTRVSRILFRADLKRSRLRGEAGAELVEFALSSSILFMLMFGVIGVGFVFFMENTAAEAARETSRWASVRGTDCNNPNIADGSCVNGVGATVQQIQAYGKSLPGAGGMTVTVRWCNSAGASCGTMNLGAGNTVQVKEAYTFASVPFVTNKTLSVSSTSESVIW
jgi:Flp pilus assembly protein TadG